MTQSPIIHGPLPIYNRLRIGDKIVLYNKARIHDPQYIYDHSAYYHIREPKGVITGVYGIKDG